MNCPSCGSEHPPERKFCGVCGQALRQASPASREVVASVPLPQPYVSAASRPADAFPPAAGLAGSAHRDKGLFIEAFQNALAWKPLSLVALGFLTIIVTLMVLTFVSAALLASTARAGSFESVGVLTVFLSIVTVVTVYATTMVFLAAVTKMCYERVVTGARLGRRESLRFAISNLGSVLVTPILLGLIVGAVFIGELVLFSAGRIEFIGPIITGASFAPMIVVNTAMYLILNYGVWLLLLSIASGSAGVGETFGTTWRLIKAAFRTMIPQLLGLTLVQIVIVVIGGMLLIIGSSLTTSFAVLGGVGSMGIEALMRGGSNLERMAEQLLFSTYGGLGRGLDGGFLIGMIARAITTALLFGLALAVPLVFFVSGSARVHQQARET